MWKKPLPMECWIDSLPWLAAQQEVCGLSNRKNKRRHPGIRRDDVLLVLVRYLRSGGVLDGRYRNPTKSTPHTHQLARNASVTGNRAARSAGNKPPIKPMPSAHFKPLHNSSGETLNWNTTWLKFAPSVATL